jgi:PAS domain S-box-containing protein
VGGLFEQVFHATQEGLALVRHRDGAFLEVNDAFLRLVGLDRAAVIGASSFELGLWADLGGEGAARAVLSERTWVEDLLAHVVHPNGSVSTIRVSAEMLRSDEEPCILVRATEASTLVGSDRFRVLREAEARYRALVEQLPAIVYTEVPDEDSPTGYRDVYISPQTVDKLGYTAREWQNDPTLWQKTAHPDDLPSLLEEETRTSKSGEAFSSTYRMIARDGSVVWFHDDAVCVIDPETGLETWRGIMLDITEQKLAEEHLREAEARYRTLIEQIPAIVYRSEFSTSGSWLYVSPQIERILGFSPEEWLLHPHPFASFCHPEDLERIREAEELSHRTGAPFTAEYRLRANDGTWRWILDEAEVVRDAEGRPLHMQGLMFDNTERRAAGERVQQALDRERAANQRLEALDGLKNTLLHTVSHDLKNPLTAIHAAAGTLRELDDRLSPDDRRELLDTLLARSERMGELLNDLLDLDRLDRGVLEPKREPVHVPSLVGRIVDDLGGPGDRTVEIDVPDVTVALDRTKCERIVDNLLRNAIRHTPEGTPITLAADHDAGADPAALTLRVDDRGPGVPDGEKEAVFEAFHRAPGPNGSEAGRTPGSGLGLSLVQRFAQLHGGRAWVEDRPGGGASFRVLLFERDPLVP